MKYVTKESEHVTNMDLQVLANSTATNPWKTALEEAKTDPMTAIETIKMSCAKEYILHRSQIHQTLFAQKARTQESYLNKQNFKGLPWDTLTWSRSLILTGPSGIGKTSLAKLLLPKALMISHIDALKEYDPTIYDGIIFDDMAFLQYPREGQIHIVDFYDDRQVHCRYLPAYIPAHTRRVFTTNLPPDKILLTQDEAIERRTVAWSLTWNKSHKRIKVSRAPLYFGHTYRSTPNMIPMEDIKEEAEEEEQEVIVYAADTQKDKGKDKVPETQYIDLTDDSETEKYHFSYPSASEYPEVD